MTAIIVMMAKKPANEYARVGNVLFLMVYLLSQISPFNPGSFKKFCGVDTPLLLVPMLCFLIGFPDKGSTITI
jgi:hypothetical protein